MEHRYSKRTPSDIRTLIYKSGLPVTVGRIRNMSRHGIFVDCPAYEVGLNQPLEVELLLHGRRAEQCSRFKCFVVRKEAEGMALSLFDDYQPSYARYAESIMEKEKASVATPRTALPHNTALGATSQAGAKVFSIAQPADERAEFPR